MKIRHFTTGLQEFYAHTKPAQSQWVRFVQVDYNFYRFSATKIRTKAKIRQRIYRFLLK